MIIKISHFPLFVHNQDDALEFYTKKLGFVLHTDTLFGQFRWLTIHAPAQKDLELIIMAAQTDFEKAMVGKQGGSKPYINLETTDCMRDYQTLVERGVKMIGKPEQQSWGLSVAFEDLYGNTLYMCQPAI